MDAQGDQHTTGDNLRSNYYRRWSWCCLVKQAANSATTSLLVLLRASVFSIASILLQPLLTHNRPTCRHASFPNGSPMNCTTDTVSLPFSSSLWCSCHHSP